MKKINVGIAGGAGYTGGELLRILVHHPEVHISFVHSSSNAGKPVVAVHSDLVGDTDLVFTNTFLDNIDVLFLCVGHGEAKKLLAEQTIAASVSIIDLSQDFRLTQNAVIADRTFVYGLPELNREKITTAKNIANPGCFATAIQLALLPLAKSGLLQDIYTTGITGSTGAGQSLSATSHFSWRANNIQAYKTLDHQHVFEIVQSLNVLQADAPLSTSGEGPGLHFVPWRGDFTRGIYTSSVIDCSLPIEAVQEMYASYYAAHPFVVVSETPLHLKQVVNTNKCVLQIEKQGNKLIVHSAIDNLIKGASGQAVQNMNLLFGLDETTGLLFKANFF
jgi:N-acetyl-gamma-glutamyl-phosphate reductase